MAATGNSAALAALLYAIANEQDGRLYYIKVAEHVQDERGRALLEGLARDEVDHYRILAAEYHSLRGSGRWLSIEEAMAATVPEIDHFRGEPGNAEVGSVPAERLFPDPEVVIPSLKRGAGDREAIELALRAEERGYQLYREAHEAAEDDNAKAAYRLLMDEESRHHEWLQRSLAYLESNDTFWDDSELPFFTG